MKKYGSIILNIFTIVFVCLGLYFAIFKDDGTFNSDAFLYYTIQSNIFVMLVAVVSLIFEFAKLKGKSICKSVYSLRFIGTVDITLTFLVFSVMLTPVFLAEGNTASVLSFASLFLHNLAPLCVIFDWCLFGKTKHITKKHTYLSMIFPFGYLIFALTRSFLGLTIEGNYVPYFFLEYKKIGWLTIGENGIGVIWWVVVLFVAIVGMCVALKKLASKNTISKQA